MINDIANFLFPYLMTFIVVVFIIIVVRCVFSSKYKEIKPTPYMIHYNKPLWMSQEREVVALLFPFQYNETVRRCLRDQYSEISYNGIVYELSRIHKVEVRYHDGIPLRMCVYLYIKPKCSPFDIFDNNGSIIQSLLFRIQGGIRCQSIDLV